MNEKGKKPPIKLSELGGEEEKKKPGEISYVGTKSSSGKSRDWGQVLLPVAIAVIASGLFMFQFAAGKGDVAALSANDQELIARVDQVDKAITGLSGEVDKALTEARSAKDQAADLVSRITALESNAPDLSEYATLGSVADLEARVAALEETAEEEEETATGCVRWRRWDVSFKPDVPDGVDYYVERDTIEEPGLYDVRLVLINHSEFSVSAWSSAIRMSIEPTEACAVDTSRTSLRFAEAPGLEWDAGFRTTRDEAELCRRITFDTYGSYSFDALDPREATYIDLEFDLYYED